MTENHASVQAMDWGKTICRVLGVNFIGYAAMWPSIARGLFVTLGLVLVLFVVEDTIRGHR